MIQPSTQAFQSAAARPRILLLGPDGQVGWELLRTLQGLGEVVPVRRASANVAGLRHSIDLSSADSVRRVTREVAPQLVVNAAAYTAVDKAESEADLAQAVNGVAPGVLSEECRLLDAALVHYSTDYVFAGDGTRPWREDDPAAPKNVYGRTKFAGEQAVAAGGAAHLILRTSWVYGIHGANFVKTILRLAGTQKELRVVNDQWGAPTSARAIADATGQILAQGWTDWRRLLRDKGGVVHLACQGETTWHGFAERILATARERSDKFAETVVRAVPSSEWKSAAARPMNSRLDCTLLRERFGIVPAGWETALAQSFPDAL